MLATSPKKAPAAHAKKRERESITPAVVPSTATEGAPRKKRRKDGAHEQWAWTALAESSVSALAPLFTPDARYFFAAAASALQIFSTATGRLVSTIPAHTDTITTLLLNPHDPSQLFSASLDGTLKRWDTHHGALLETLRIDQPVTHIAAHSSLPDELFVVTTARSGKNSDSSHVFRIATKSSHQLPTPSPSAPPPKARKSSSTIHVGKTRRATGLAISSCGTFLIVVGGTKAYVARIGSHPAGFTTFVSPDPLTCLAVHPSEAYFATGDERGVVRLWYCLNDTALPTSTTQPTDPSSSSSKPRTDADTTAPTTTLHWHAHAVSALSFTPSGAHLLSGGEEAVLVVWHLHSGQREYIPRVGAPIGGVAVCMAPAGGMEYAIALVDGGVVFVGSDTLRIGRAVRRVRLDPTQPNPSRPLPLAIHPTSKHIVLPAAHPSSLQVLAGVGGGLVGELEVAPASRVSRRDEAPIEPVRVGLVALSGAGRRGKGKASGEAGAEWLATVDSRADAEVYLKLWKWGVGSGSGSNSMVTASTSSTAPNTTSTTTTTTGSNLCTLNTRIDRPHGDHRVTSLVFHPAGAEVLVTTGEDELVKMWGVRRDQREEFWVCTAAFNYRNHIPSKAVFSPDGSLLAVLHGSCVTLWNTDSDSDDQIGETKRSRAGEMCGALTCVEAREPRELTFVGSSGRYVAVLGLQAVVVWDLAKFSVLWHVALEQSPSQTHIVSHPTLPTFALFQYPDTRSTRITVFGVSTSTPVRTRTLPFRLEAPVWTEGAGEIGVLGVGATGTGIGSGAGNAGTWSLVLAGDDVRQTVDEGATARGISVDTAPFVPRTLFEDIFGRGAVGAGIIAGSTQAEAAGKGKETEVGREARRKLRKLKKKAAKAERAAEEKPKPKPNGVVVDEVRDSDSEIETPESSEPATEGDVEVEAVAYVGMKRKASLGGDGTIHPTKKINGVVGVHSASDEDEEESGEEVV